MYETTCVLAAMHLFLSLEKSAQIWPLKSHSSLYPIDILLHSFPQHLHSCDKSSMWLHELHKTMLKIAVAITVQSPDLMDLFSMV